MHPFHFGTSERPLFGVYHAPQGFPTRSAGIVLCYPWGREYMRAHRAFRQLALLLCRRGFPVLRFDYYGTGDSAGDDVDGRVGLWVDDVIAATEELRETADVGTVSLIGLRLGATLAMTAAPALADVSTITLWDPVVDGRAYMRELLASSPSNESRPRRGRRLAEEMAATSLKGFPVSPSLRADIERIDLTRVKPSAAHLRMIVSRPTPEYDELRTHLETERASLEYHHVPCDGDWKETDNFGSVLVPRDSIQAIAEGIDAGVAP